MPGPQGAQGATGAQGPQGSAGTGTATQIFYMGARIDFSQLGSLQGYFALDGQGALSPVGPNGVAGLIVPGAFDVSAIIFGVDVAISSATITYTLLRGAVSYSVIATGTLPVGALDHTTLFGPVSLAPGERLAIGVLLNLLPPPPPPAPPPTPIPPLSFSVTIL